MGKLSCDAIKMKAFAEPNALGFRFCLGLLHASRTFLISEACFYPGHAFLIVMADIQDANPISQHK